MSWFRFTSILILLFFAALSTAAAIDASILQRDTLEVRHEDILNKDWKRGNVESKDFEERWNKDWRRDDDGNKDWRRGNRDWKRGNRDWKRGNKDWKRGGNKDWREAQPVEVEARGNRDW